MHGIVAIDILAYLDNKLKEANKNIDKYTKDLVLAANSLNFDSIKNCTDRIKAWQEKKQEISTDFTEYTSVAEVVARIELLDAWSLQNVYGYKISITAEEAKLLKNTGKFYSTNFKIKY